MLAIRGAVQVDEDTPEAIGRATEAMLAAIVRDNALVPDDVVSAIFTLTTDLRAAFPAATARRVGWAEVPMICAQEIPVPGALPRVCRVLLHVRREGKGKHVYLGAAQALRPDLGAP